MTPREELELLELEAKAKGQPVAAEPSSFGEDAWKGAKASVRGMGQGFARLLPSGAQDAVGLKEFADSPVQKAPDTAGGLTGSIGTEIASFLVPGGGILKGGKLLQKALAARGALGTGTAAMIGADVGGNAALSAAAAPENRDTAAGWGAAGAAGGRVLSRTLGGAMRESVSPQAQRLIDAGVHITPGQALTGPQAGITARTIRGAEDKITSIPFVGDVIANAQQRGLKSFNINRINDALAPIGASIKHAGVEGLDAADQHISDAYDAVLPQIKVVTSSAMDNIINGLEAAKADPLFDVAHLNKLEMFIDRRIVPLLGSAEEISGPVAKKLDAELGELGRKYSASGVGNEPLGNGFNELRKAWRDSMEGTTDVAKTQLSNANKAFAKLVPLLKAGEKNAQGVFTPMQLSNALRQLKMQPDQLAEAGRQVLPTTVPDSGTAGRQIFGRLVMPEAAGAGAGIAATGLAGFGPAAAAGLGAAAMYTKSGLKGLTSGVHPLVEALRAKLTKQAYDPNQIEDIIRNLTGRGITAAGTE